LQNNDKKALEDIHFIKTVTIGSVNPNNPLTNALMNLQRA